MIEVSETRDFFLVKEIFTDPAIYDWAAQDSAPAAEDFRPCEVEGIRYLAIRDDGIPAGAWMLVPHSDVCYEVHTAILPWFRGGNAVRAAQVAVAWVWEKTPCMRLITNVPKYNRAAAMFCRMVGMKLFGTNEKAFMKDGKLHDLLMFGISKPGVS